MAHLYNQTVGLKSEVIYHHADAISIYKNKIAFVVYTIFQDFQNWQSGKDTG